MEWFANLETWQRVIIGLTLYFLARALINLVVGWRHGYLKRKSKD